MKLGETALPSVILADSLDAIQLPVGYHDGAED